MMPTEVRALMLSQHEGIRALAHTMLASAERVRAGSSEEAGHLDAAIAALARAIAAHNADEQRLLEQALPSADAWGAIRCASMDDHHRREHVAMRAAIKVLMKDTPPERLFARLRVFVDDLLRHMEVEERVLLHSSVLRDDVCVIDTFGG